MSTRSYIACRSTKDAPIVSIYCHWDGYPEYNGMMLKRHYAEPLKVRTLMDLGDISSLRERIAPDFGQIHTFEEPQPDVTIAYYRDRGEPWDNVKPQYYPNLKEFCASLGGSWAEYAYLFTCDTKEWKAFKVRGVVLIEVPIPNPNEE